MSEEVEEKDEGRGREDGWRENGEGGSRVLILLSGLNYRKN